MLKLDYPTLTSDHLENARLFATREEMVSALYGEPGGVVVEVGVAVGNFSKFLIETIKPDKFVAIDLFEFHKHAEIWGTPTTKLLNNQNHRSYYEGQLQRYQIRIDVHEGLSHDGLSRLPDASADMIYIDAGHSYEDVKRDCDIAIRKANRNGMLIFNDYIMLDHFYNTPYGVVQTVNELCASSNWKIIGLSLQQHLFCDVALRRF
jgi:hypothetical protein